jgi:cytochrome c
MKKVLLLLSACALLAACDSGYKQDGPDQVNAAKPATEKSDELNSDSASGSNVTAVAHQPQVDTSTTKIGTAPTGTPSEKGGKLLGPAYTAVAQKYPATPANVNMLAAKVISGGSGHWGDIAMTPHPGLSKSDAQEMVRYILSLK